ncbi:hypothetical protein FIBSPDRAFT_870475 [Athelia psychrophila]|uniref:Uncharacterized protein n=1 Tax=Athelia psychrophila TaxID=1759441 RepID=A0A166B0M9_9AGAM|nr:hypothetical protein FIBSPDRAFT_870475 [Fibularhizoctonia sp. CBS 109695]
MPIGLAVVRIGSQRTGKEYTHITIPNALCPTQCPCTERQPSLIETITPGARVFPVVLTRHHVQSLRPCLVSRPYGVCAPSGLALLQGLGHPRCAAGGQHRMSGRWDHNVRTDVGCHIEHRRPKVR